MTEPGAGEPDGRPTDPAPSAPPQLPPASTALPDAVPSWPYAAPSAAAPVADPVADPVQVEQLPPQPAAGRTAAEDVWLPPEPMVGAPLLPELEPGWRGGRPGSGPVQPTSRAGAGPRAAAGPRQAWQPRPYPQLLRGPGFRWWRPLLSLGVMLAGIAAVFGAAVVGGILLFLVADLTGRGTEASGPFSGNWESSPGGMLFTNLLLAALIPAAMVAVWVGCGWRPRWVGSVVGGLRWRWLAICSGVAAVAIVVPAVVLTGFTEDLTTWTPERQWPLLAAVVVVTTPLQAAGEEYAFRGWLPQTIGSMFADSRVGALVGNGVASVLFAFAHGQQDPWLFADRLVFGLVACWLVWRTGGLEAGIAVHSVNNLSVFGFTIAQGQLRDSITVTRASAGEVVFDVVTLLVVGAVLTGLALRFRVTRLFVPPS